MVVGILTHVFVSIIGTSPGLRKTGDTKRIVPVRFLVDKKEDLYSCCFSVRRGVVVFTIVGRWWNIDEAMWS